MSFPRFCAGLVLLTASAAAQKPASQYTQADGGQFLKTYCASCHTGRTPAGGFDVMKLALPASLRQSPEVWTKAAMRVHNGEMPPRSTVPIAEREAFAGWVDESLRAEACSAGIVAGPAPVRRLSRAQYTNSL